ncbi:tubulin-specific chaperone E [Pogonomyrmex barbatus]|uniref:Dynein axonemal assembly factor 1 homolog n=1 Tax=Pogonomyrmex barbatus TaxID=144034 RepID=A0A6I9W7M3_9HYME|nr:tubulin-specific chaperone E [Pogonomyrmex barbatus]
MVEDKKYEIGSRIECDGYRGTLKYVGSVGDTKGEWLGIDWDDPTRGKHNGTYEGMEYFQARHSTSGSFIRPGKAKFGISCPQAIEMRYGLIDDELAGIDRGEVSSLRKEINAPFLELVGFSEVNKKQSKFDELKIAWLRDQRVSNAGKPGELEELCPNLEDLDLSKNLINSWKIIAEICSQLCSLVFLNVSENYLPIEDVATLEDSFPTVRLLTIAKMNYNWSDIRQCISIFPSIEELSVSFNVISTIDEITVNTDLMKISTLILEGNLISSWDEILKLGSLPCLENLNVSSNKIDRIVFPSSASTHKTALFPKLYQLNISENNISEWQSISELDKLSKLDDLKFRENPVLKNKSIETARQLIIAKIENLMHLNGTLIFHDERRGAEYDYLKLYLPIWLETENNPEKRMTFINEHPRYPILVDKYGIADIPSIRPKVEFISNVITVDFVCPDDPSHKIKRKLFKDMDVQKMIGVAQRLFKTDGKIPTLSFIPRNHSSDEIPLDKPLQKVSYYSIQDGDQIIVRW